MSSIKEGKKGGRRRQGKSAAREAAGALPFFLPLFRFAPLILSALVAQAPAAKRRKGSRE